MWIIGDIHGCARELERLLLRISEEDQLLFLGDYIDRGPDTYRVIEILLGVQHRSIFLKGNHEDMLLAYYKKPDSSAAQAWRYAPNGAPATLKSYKLTYESTYEDYPPAHRNFLENLDYYYEASNFIAVHAGVRPGIALARQSREDLLWIRHDWIRKEHNWQGPRVYYGHTPSRYILGEARQHEIIKGVHSLGLDTGCVFGGSLTAFNSETEQLIQIPAEQKYY